MRDWLPSLNALRAFEVVSRHLSYLRAADELGVTRGAVKQMVSKLEESLGSKLLERKGHDLVLTPVGNAAQNDLRLGMKHLTNAVRTVRRREHSSRVIVTVEASLAATWLVPKLPGFWVEHPEIDVLIDSSQKIIDLSSSDYDIAIRYGVPHKDGLFVERLFEDKVCPACSPSIAHGSPALERLEQLDEVPLIHWDMSHLNWARETRRWFTWEGWQERMGISDLDVSRGRRFSDYALAVNAAVSGQGVMLAGLPTLQDLVDEGLLTIPFPDKILQTNIGFDLVATRSALERAEVIAFSDWLLSTAAKYKAKRG